MMKKHRVQFKNWKRMSHTRQIKMKKKTREEEAKIELHPLIDLLYEHRNQFGFSCANNKNFSDRIVFAAAAAAV